MKMIVVFNYVITHSQETNILNMLVIVKAKNLPHFPRIYIEEFRVCYEFEFRYTLHNDNNDI